MAQAVRDVFIAPVQEGKGRTFRASALGMVEANALWAGGSGGGDTKRPVFAVFAGSDQEMRPFMANLVAGRKAILGDAGGYRSRRDTKLELLKSAGYEVAWQREGEGTLATVFLPDLFRMDPGMVDPAGATFVLLPRQAWLDAQEIDGVNRVVEHAAKLNYPIDDEQLRDLVSLAFLFVVYLDRRTRCPIYADGRFYLQLLLAFLSDGSAVLPGLNDSKGYRFGDGNGSLGFRPDDMTSLGITRALAFRAGHETVEHVLAEQTTIFFERARV